uniref:A disintegrin and metalloproteinase with thrombospondin motifs 6 n=1 Tax=Lygus hesperus TaxID=30085 RepID=A0A0A9XKL0_LYGHE
MSNKFIVFVCFAFFADAEVEYKGRYTRDLKDYEVVVPTKVSEDGAFVSYYLPHFYNVARVQRGVDSGKINYVVPIRGKNKVLELEPSEDFYAPGIVIEHHEKDARSHIDSVKLRKPRPRRCYYHGRVKNEPDSSVAITACTGLAGYIRLGKEQYLIEPVDDEGKPTVDVKHRHLLYKRAHQRVFANQSSCGTTGKSSAAFQKRMEWEEKYGKKLEESMKSTSDDELPARFDNGKVSIGKPRHERFCTTCKPNKIQKCVTPHAPCSTDMPLFIELLMVVGPRVAETAFIDEDVEQYVNTVINIVVKHFQDSSLGRPILVKLVRVITIGYLYEELDAKKHNPQEALKNFCQWQMHFNPRMEDHPNHHDFAIYMVKFEPCQGSIIGLTNMASMCRPDRACAIVSEEGLLTGHIITHMLGHSLGAEHDDSSTSSCCPEEPDGTRYHMGPQISSRSSAWSVCSKQCILQFVKTHAGWCLTDIPTATDLSEPAILPGQVYSAAEQCRINFEIETYACLVGEYCKRLYCKINDRECVSTGDPPAQGTKCGPNMWCFNRKCVHRGSRPGATNGEWGSWSPWTPCTKTCGGGTQTSHRACDSPSPSRGGRLCPGTWLRNRMCNVGSCPDAGRSFLDQQCKLTNNKPYHGRKHEWLSFIQQIEDLQCVVVCINERNEVAVRSPLAVDGTFCKPGYKDVCIRGTCKPVGCDWGIGSNAKEDACGICHGNGTECRIMQGYFGDRDVKGIVEFLKLPIGTSMVLVRETRPSPCFFLITNSLNNSFYLNNDREEQMFFTGAFTVEGTVGVYQLKGNMERIFIKEPLGVPITISMVCHDVETTLGILYQYALPEPNNPSSIPSYTWEFLSWEKCPFPCGGGAQRAIPVCVEAQGGEVEDCYCSLQAKPPDKVRVCNRRPCEARWWVGPWASCECFHQEGVTTRMVMCAHLKEARSSYITIMPEQECAKEAKPRSERPCDPVKEQEAWTARGYSVKRDITDMIPYSEAAEDYSVWDEVAEDKYPYMVNVRKMFHGIDPENVEDYTYLRNIGMTSDIWKRIHGSHQSSNRIRRRRQQVIPTSTAKPEADIEEDEEDKKVKKVSKTSKPKKLNEDTTTISTQAKKSGTDITKKRAGNVDKVMENVIDEKGSSTPRV